MKSPGLFLCFFLFVGIPLSAETTAIVRTTIQKIGGENPPARLTITTDIPKTEIYIHGRYEGIVPLTLNPAPPGFLQISLLRDGYYPETLTVESVLGEYKTIKVELRPKTGTISIENAPATTSFSLPSSGIYIPGEPLSEGSYTLRLDAFGYIPKNIPVIVTQGRTTSVDGTLERAPFLLLSFKPEERAYNPESNTPLSLLVSATAPGTALIVINNSEGHEVRTLTSEVFTTLTTRVLWDGTDTSGSTLPDGLYTATVKASPLSNTTTLDGQINSLSTSVVPPSSVLTETAQIYLDRSIVYRYTSLFSGTGSTGSVVSASLMPPATMAVSIFSEVHDGSFSPGASFLIGITKNLEAGAMACVPVETDGNVNLDYAFSIKAGFSSNAHNAAFHLGYRRTQGVTVGPAYEFRLGPVSAGIHAHAIIKDNGGILYKPDAYAAAGIALRGFYGPVALGGWFQMQTSRITSTMIFDETLSTGIMVKCFIPSTDLFVNAEGSCHWNDSLDDAIYSLTAGFGLFF